MTLKKTIAGHFKGSEWVEQQEVEMHPLEEEETRAYWAIHDAKIKIPPKPTKEQEHEWLIEHGPEFVKNMRQQWQTKHDEIMPEVEAAEAKFQKCHQDWCDHAEHCHANGLDKDKHDKEKHAHLVEKYKDDEHSKQAKEKLAKI